MNLPKVMWPLALGLIDAHQHAVTRWLADALVVAVALRNLLWVGTALGAYSPEIWPYVPQLPIEWAALALGTSSWVTQRRRAISRRERLIWAALTTLAVVAAAVLETFGVPHQ